MSTEQIATTQAELDKALADPSVDRVIIDSPDGVWLELATDRRDVTVGIRGSSLVGPVSGSATVRDVGDSATVSGVWDSATVSGVSDSATVRGVSGSAIVSGVSDSAIVSGVWGSATVSDVSGSATVRGVSGSAIVSGVSGSAIVSGVWGSATVSGVWGACAIVGVYDEARLLNLGPLVSVHLHSASATVEGGHVIDISALDLEDPATWCAYHCVKVTDGIATVYKAVGDNWSTDRGTDYSPGSTPEAPDWQPTKACGGGLHFSPSPVQSRGHYPTATRYLECGVLLADLVPLGSDKCKAPRVVRACVEVDINGKPVQS